MKKTWYVIKSKVKGLYWHNVVGWVDLKSATRFAKEEIDKFLYLPCEAIGWRKIND